MTPDTQREGEPLSEDELDEWRDDANSDPWGEVVGHDERRLHATIDALRERVDQAEGRGELAVVSAKLRQAKSALTASKEEVEKLREALETIAVQNRWRQATGLDLIAIARAALAPPKEV